jgi:TolB-like protein/tetratricopeptide (TPR) repeat protein
MRRGGFFYEMGRRRVWQVAGAYIVLGWVGVEIVLETFPLLGLPDWIPRVVVIVAYLGFPVVVTLAWVFDVTPQGLVVTPRLEDEEGAGAAPPRVVIEPRPRLLAGVFGAGMLVALVAFGAYSALSPMERVRPETIQAVAVLPFSDLSAAQDQQHFADGVAEELINRLGRIGELRVAARTSSFEFRGASGVLDEIGRRLNVDAVVEGSIRREGDRLRVTVELVDVATGYQIWAGSYDRTVDDIFSIQDEISGAIVDALRLHLTPGMVAGAGTSNVRAHDAYLLGLGRWHGRTPQDLLKARDYFLEAIAADPDYALAHAGLALTYAVLPLYTDVPVDQAMEAGYEAAGRALALNAHLAEAHAAIGQIAQALEWNLTGAEVAYRRALDAQPSYATGHQWYAETLLITGRLAEARLEIDRALELDPLSVSARFVHAYLMAVERDYAGAMSAFRSLVADHPEYRFGHAGLVFFCLAAGCPDVAAATARLAFPDGVAQVVEQAGRATSDPALVPAALAQLRQHGGRLPSSQRALLHTALGDRAGALDILEQSHQVRDDPLLILFLVHPLFDPLRPDPRFRALADAVGVEAPAWRLARR